MRWTARFTAMLLCAGLLAAGLSGCVERSMIIRSEPPGARVTLNGEDIGPTPVIVPFQTYGTYDISASYPRRGRIREAVPVNPPWYEHIPLDFFFETLWPFTLHDEHEITLSLGPVGVADDSGIEQREVELRERMDRGPEQ